MTDGKLTDLGLGHDDFVCRECGARMRWWRLEEPTYTAVFPRCEGPEHHSLRFRPKADDKGKTFGFDPSKIRTDYDVRMNFTRL